MDKQRTRLKFRRRDQERSQSTVRLKSIFIPGSYGPARQVDPFPFIPFLYRTQCLSRSSYIEKEYQENPLIDIPGEVEHEAIGPNHFHEFFYKRPISQAPAVIESGAKALMQPQTVEQSENSWEPSSNTATAGDPSSLMTSKHLPTQSNFVTLTSAQSGWLPESTSCGASVNSGAVYRDGTAGIYGLMNEY